MYGMVNKGLRAFALSLGGEDAWQAIRAKAEVEPDRFVSMQAYPDAMTYALATAAAEVLSQPLAAVLEQFGRFWVPYVKEEGYGELMAMVGDTLPAFLGNLDAMHTRLSLSFPEFKPPSFRLEDPGGGRYLLHYRSERPALAPFVVGLVHGVAEELGQTVDIRLQATREDGSDHDVLEIRLKMSASSP
jgi:hypothetical protein